MKSNIVAIVGRPNVGKSTLFNRLTESRKAIVDKFSGVTRDRHYGECEWNGEIFSVIDTGGYVEHSKDIFEKEIKKQVLLAIDEADAIIFMVDVLTGITDLDEKVAILLKKGQKKIFPVVNKVDNSERLYEATEFYKLGLGEIYSISSINGSGTGDLLDAVVKSFKKKNVKQEKVEHLPKFAIIGRPNVGKSSLLNSLIGEERNIVTPISGTTRDTIYTRYKKFDFDFLLVDTAGLRKKGKITENLEFYSVIRSIKAIENSDVCLLMIDATLGIESQDLNIFHLVVKNNKGVVILVNKWDLIIKEKNITEKYTNELKEKLAPFNDVPVHYISAITKQRIHRVLEEALIVYKNRTQKIQTSKLNKVMLEVIENYGPPMIRGKNIKIKYVAQLSTHAPSFAFYCNYPQYIKENYKRYLENQLRKNFNFTGVPVQIFFRKK
ncbi:MAG: ribosome biogenesis GTPase Der [Bacteroidales bacterium]|nr:ribosome biogenesis GTPase Der [Bacteroidales bacterium]